MIRLVAVLLLVANLVLWYWFYAGQRQGDDQPPAASKKPSAPVATIHLLSELQSQHKAVVSQPQATGEKEERNDQTVVVEDPPGDKPRAKPLGCRVLGPVESAEQAAQLKRRLVEAEIKADIATREVDGGIDYWVYLEPMESAVAATSLLQELQVKGIDSYVFPVGEFENGISLGVFANRENARRLQVKIKAEGYDAKVHEVPRRVARYWLFFPAAEGSPVPTIAAVASLDEKMLPRYFENPCETVASGRQFQ